MQQLKEMLGFTGIDVEKLVNDYTRTLQENNNIFATETASIMALKEWATQKEWLIRQVMAMPGYNGNLQSVGIMEIPYQRTPSDVRRAVDSLWINLFRRGDSILSKVDKEGKSMEDYIAEELANLPERINIKSLGSYSGKASKISEVFSDNGFTKESVEDYNLANNLILGTFKNYVSSRLDDTIVDKIKSVCPSIGVAKDMKTTRALGKIIKKFGLEDKTSGSTYAKEFIAKYCEVMKEGGMKRLFVVSVNPIDYLKMSIGEFTSCHDIRDGGWKSGTISYMLDKVTLITYTVAPNTEMEYSGVNVSCKDRPELFSKIERNVCHWDEYHRLIQSRVYPQAKDGCTDLYAAFRHEIQSRISQANGWDPDKWTNRRRRYMEFTQASSGSTNYTDWYYERFGGNLSTPGHSSDFYSTEPFIIGAQPMCVKCGKRHSRSGNMKCGTCY